MPVRNFGDLLYAVAAAPAGQDAPLAVVRGKERKELSSVVPAGKPGSISAEGSVKGTLVFDATAGRLVRRELTPLKMQVVASSGGNPVAQVTTGSAVLQLVPGP